MKIAQDQDSVHCEAIRRKAWGTEDIDAVFERVYNPPPKAFKIRLHSKSATCESPMQMSASSPQIKMSASFPQITLSDTPAHETTITPSDLPPRRMGIFHNTVAHEEAGHRSHSPGHHSGDGSRSPRSRSHDGPSSHGEHHIVISPPGSASARHASSSHGHSVRSHDHHDHHHRGGHGHHSEHSHHGDHGQHSFKHHAHIVGKVAGALGDHSREKHHHGSHHDGHHESHHGGNHGSHDKPGHHGKPSHSPRGHPSDHGSHSGGIHSARGHHHSSHG